MVFHVLRNKLVGNLVIASWINIHLSTMYFSQVAEEIRLQYNLMRNSEVFRKFQHSVIDLLL